MESTDKANEKNLRLNVGATIFEMRKEIIEEHPDSLLEAIFSGRQKVTTVIGMPYIDRNPHLFKKVLTLVENHGDVYQIIDSELEDELTFWGIDSDNFNKLFLNNFFKCNPIP